LISGWVSAVGFGSVLSGLGVNRHWLELHLAGNWIDASRQIDLGTNA
jgi:hypothetical protein